METSLGPQTPNLPQRRPGANKEKTGMIDNDPIEVGLCHLNLPSPPRTTRCRIFRNRAISAGEAENNPFRVLTTRPLTISRSNCTRQQFCQEFWRCGNISIRRF